MAKPTKRKPAMNEQANKKALQEFDLAPGLLSYYSTQAELMLVQYENINNLLGPTHDWTHPGNYCEVLFRDFLRKFLPPYLSVDKGYFYGREVIENKNSHCPEIDILIHNSHEHAPLFKMDDFVIVKPQAVRGMIQMKRTLTKEEVEKGIRNVATAKKHIIKIHEKTPDLWREPGLEPRVFTAVVGFGDEVGANIDFYQSILAEFKDKGFEDSLPNSIGSLTKALVHHAFGSLFVGYDSNYNGKNMFIQIFLDTLYRGVLPPYGNKGHRLPFEYPKDMKTSFDFSIPGFNKVDVSDEIVRIELKNDTIRTFTKVEASLPANHFSHLEVDARGAVTITPNLKARPGDPEIVVKKANGTLQKYTISSGN
jgi:hypothetical protein